jgi:hypothetical protein
MTSRERMLCALERGEPDRLPASVHQWQAYHLKKYMGGVSDIEAFRAVGLDAALPFWCLVYDPDPSWQTNQKEAQLPNGNASLHTTITTPAGTLTMSEESNDWTSWIVEPPIKKPEDIACLRYRPVPRLDREALRARKQALGEDGIIRGFVWPSYQGGCWQDACAYHGTEAMIMATFDRPDWVNEFLTILNEPKLLFIERELTGVTDIDLVETGGGASSSTVISPAIHERFCLPFDRLQHDALHAAGMRVVYHTCGGMMPILDLIVANGCDASETLAPAEVGGDAVPARIKKQIGDKVALIGGLNQFQILTDGTPQQIRKHVHELFDALGPGGGYIMSPSDHFFHTPAENLKAYADAAKECVY